MIDYRALLVKYMGRVSGLEGVTYIEDIRDWQGYQGSEEFTEEEIAALEAIHQEVMS